ncbi:MAG: hypothetical protein H0T46_00420 [Deltaproteobacteria bacterium]|nr:hypothetical protein [Deltaproteobacteria bacterium]
MLRIVTVVGVLTAATAAFAQPAPQTDDWNNVSHINGSLVKVGERHEYVKVDPKRFNISTNPIGFLVGFYGLSVQGKVSEHVTLRGNVEFFAYEFFGRTTGHELAASMPIYFRRAFSGPFIEPGFIYQETQETPWDLFGDGDSTPVAHTHAGPSMVFGWHWTFDSGLNFAVALGGTRNMNRQPMTDSGEYQSDVPQPTGYLRIGYAF